MMTEQQRVVIAWTVFYFNALLCIVFFDIHTIGLRDAIRGLDEFSNDTFRLFGYLTVDDQAVLRFCMAIFTMVELEILRRTKLINTDDLIFYLIWPASAYLATKIKHEFVFFPLCMIAVNLPWKKELTVIGLVATISALLVEQNGVLIILFRLGCIFCKTTGKSAKYYCMAFLAACYFIDNNISLLFDRFPALQAYEYTRTATEKNYSWFKTIGAFVSTLHMSAWPQTDWPYDLPFSLIIAALCWWRKGIQYFLNLPAALSLVCTMFFFTSVTHAFQDARYWYFYLPILAKILGDKFWLIVALSIAHVLLSGTMHEFFPAVPFGIYDEFKGLPQQ